jgi:hypothetical protein
MYYPLGAVGRENGGGPREAVEKGAK